MLNVVQVAARRTRSLVADGIASCGADTVADECILTLL